MRGGALYDPKVLDIKEDDLMDSVTGAITRVAAASLELGYPTMASIPHSVINGYKKRARGLCGHRLRLPSGREGMRFQMVA